MSSTFSLLSGLISSITRADCVARYAAHASSTPDSEQLAQRTRGQSRLARASSASGRSRRDEPQGPRRSLESGWPDQPDADDRARPVDPVSVLLAKSGVGFLWAVPLYVC